jgi:general secretion pathway protein A
MYQSFFGLRENPFSLSPNPQFLYRSPHHEEALANLIYGVQNRKGFIALTGEVGTGKTTMLECLRDYLTAHNIAFGFIFNSRLNPEQFFEMLAHDFSLPCTRFSKTDVLFSLNTMLLERSRTSTSVLIIDEAHNLEWDVLEEIRLLGNLENRHGKLIQIVLSGQPELDAKLDAPQYRQLKQRIALRCSLRPLNEVQAAQYISYRLAHAGSDDQKIFPVDAVRDIHRRSGGIPRVINLLCDNTMLTAFAMNSKVVTLSMIEEVCSDLRIETPVPVSTGATVLTSRPVVTQ